MQLVTSLLKRWLDATGPTTYLDVAIWNTAADLFPQGIQILDRCHGKEGFAPGCSIFGATNREDQA